MPPKNGAGAQKNTHIFKSNARTLLKLGVCLDYMYTNGLDYMYTNGCVMSSWSKTTSKSFVTKGDLMQQPLWQVPACKVEP